MIGVQIHPTMSYQRGYSAEEKKRRDEFIDRTYPSPVMVLQDYSLAKEYKKRYPERDIIFREGDANEENVWNYVKNVDNLYDKTAKFTDNGIKVNVFNENDGYSLDTVKRVCDLTSQLAIRFKQNGLYGIFQNWSVGNPNEKFYPSMETCFKVLQASGQGLGLHEYGTYRGMMYTDEQGDKNVFPYRVGRFTWIVDYCEKHSIECPDLWFTEYGRDSSQYKRDDNSRRGYKDSILPGAYATELIETYLKLYKPYRQVKGLIVFCFGNSGQKGSFKDWHSHDVFTEPFMNIMEQWYASQEKPTPQPPAPNTKNKIMTEISSIQARAEQLTQDIRDLRNYIDKNT